MVFSTRALAEAFIAQNSTNPSYTYEIDEKQIVVDPQSINDSIDAGYEEY